MLDGDMTALYDIAGYRIYRLLRRATIIFILFGLAIGFILRPNAAGTLQLLMSWFSVSQGVLITWCAIGGVMVMLDELAQRPLNLMWIGPVVFYAAASTAYFVQTEGPISVMVLYWALAFLLILDWLNDMGFFRWLSRLHHIRSFSRDS